MQKKKKKKKKKKKRMEINFCNFLLFITFLYILYYQTKKKKKKKKKKKRNGRKYLCVYFSFVYPFCTLISLYCTTKTRRCAVNRRSAHRTMRSELLDCFALDLNFVSPYMKFRRFLPPK